MSTGKRGADKLNIIGVVAVGICGSVLTYVSIVALEAYYMNETAAIERSHAHEAPNSMRTTIRANQETNLDGVKEGTISIDKAKALVLKEYRADNSELIPGKPSVKPTVEAWYGRPPTLKAPEPAPEPPVTPPDTVPAPDGTTVAPPATDPATPATDPATPPTTPPAETPPATTPTTPPATAPGANGP